ncbi:hypothetical protein GCM10007978_40710 [Shewanella hanedai]|uniref:Uncharacterized protein n=1 Tax=Shewanella hanedai TaxID=25 RepID=A0A553JKP2_SHEHA|nr:hypothetical protein [Shewanella hanedai]TRY13017.1 hypothetical protein FN961_17230 [Shewanella hanedai]GGI98751.1 hypothetical protein GCM10007978_40710 [Shewanella hanedai]
MTTIYLSVPYKKENGNGDVKKDVDEALATGIATGYIFNDTQLSDLKGVNDIKVVLIDRIRKRRVEGEFVSLSSTNKSTRFGMRHDIIISKLNEVVYAPVVFKYHRTGVKLITYLAG